jgi:hypothetical protein
MFNTKDLQKLERYLSSMDEYLNLIIDEYEHELVKGSTINLSKQKRVGDFIGDYKESYFRYEFIHAYYNAYDVLISTLAGKKLIIEEEKPITKPLKSDM